MISSLYVPVPYRIIALIHERNRLFSYSLIRLAGEIKAAGFQCTRCGTCCTRGTNGHIFLLDPDVADVKKIDPDAFEPAPDPEFCDQNGTMYVSGFALRMKNDSRESCWFLENGNCRIYERRFTACRIYPHMLRRTADATGRVAWRLVAKMHKHGQYFQAVSDDYCLALARTIKEYENACLTHQISFLEKVHEYFSVHNLRHDQEMYSCQIRRFLAGGSVNIMVYHAGDLEKHHMIKPDISR